MNSLTSNTIYIQYKADIASGLIDFDESQEQAVNLLQDLFNNIMQRELTISKPLGIIKFLWLRHFNPIQSLYLWGGVGRGKTYLMDMFYDSLPIEKKMRKHFHRFMLKVHEQLTALEGHDEPLKIIADNFSNEYRVICFDEFYVSDIADAMVLGALLEHLFSRGVVVVFTSNVQVDDLYSNGLQRQRFLQTISLLKKHCTMFEVDSGIDYRLNILTKAGAYHLSSEQKVLEKVKKDFNKLTPVQPMWDTTIEIDGRNIDVYGIADDVIWFTFASICQTARSSRDYIEIASCFHTVVVSTVPKFDSSNEDSARRFIALIDELYDRSVNVILLADVLPEDLYEGNILRFQFKRTASRLTEMQSKEYLAQPHNP